MKKRTKTRKNKRELRKFTHKNPQKHLQFAGAPRKNKNITVKHHDTSSQQQPPSIYSSLYDNIGTGFSSITSGLSNLGSGLYNFLQNTYTLSAPILTSFVKNTGEKVTEYTIDYKYRTRTLNEIIFYIRQKYQQIKIIYDELKRREEERITVNSELNFNMQVINNLSDNYRKLLFNFEILYMKFVGYVARQFDPLRPGFTRENTIEPTIKFKQTKFKYFLINTTFTVNDIIKHLDQIISMMKNYITYDSQGRIFLGKPFIDPRELEAFSKVGYLAVNTIIEASSLTGLQNTYLLVEFEPEFFNKIEFCIQLIEAFFMKNGSVLERHVNDIFPVVTNLQDYIE